MAVNEQAWKIGYKWTKGDASNPTGAVAVDTTSKAVHIADIADIATDWNVSADSHPSVYIHSATTPATDYIKMWHDATDAYINGVGAATLYFQIAGTTEMELAAAALTLSAPLTVGVDDTGYDVTFFGATASSKMLWDESDDRLEFDGADINLQDSDILQFGDAQDVAITWNGTNLTINPVADDTGILLVGTDTTLGMDVRFSGGTASCYLLWDNSEDQLVLTQTNAATTGVERTLDISQTHTAIGASAEALRSTITTNVAGGTFMNALFGKIDFQTAGKVTGLAGVICSELTMAEGAVSQGTYCTFESEINLPTSYSSSVPVMALRMEVWGAQKATFDTSGYLFEIVGCSSTNNGFWYDATNGTTDEWIRVKTPSGNRWLMLSDSPTEA